MGVFKVSGEIVAMGESQVLHDCTAYSAVHVHDAAGQRYVVENARVPSRFADLFHLPGEKELIFAKFSRGKQLVGIKGENGQQEFFFPRLRLRSGIGTIVIALGFLIACVSSDLLVAGVIPLALIGIAMNRIMNESSDLGDAREAFYGSRTTPPTRLEGEAIRL